MPFKRAAAPGATVRHQRKEIPMNRISFGPDRVIRRRPDGSIDTTVYIARARTLRAKQANRLARALRTSVSSREAVLHPFSRSTLPAR